MVTGMEKMLEKAIKVWKEEEDMQIFSKLVERFSMLPKKRLRDRLIAEGLYPPKRGIPMSKMADKAKCPGSVVSFWVQGK